MTVFVVILLGCSFGVGFKLWELRQARQRIEALQARMHAPPAEIVTIRLAADATIDSAFAAPAPTPPQGLATQAETEEAAQRRAKLQALRGENAELVGWIKLDDTPIDYPVMQSVSRPWHYLDHDFEDERSKSGLPFIEEVCDISGNRANWIIYGHNMKNGTMFGGLHSLTEQAFYETHRILQFDTPERAGSYKIVSVFYMVVDTGAGFQFYHYPNIESEELFQTYADNVLSASIYPADTSLAWGDELLTLVTCSKHADDGRLVVVAKRV